MTIFVGRMSNIMIMDRLDALFRSESWRTNQTICVCGLGRSLFFGVHGKIVGHLPELPEL